MKIKVSSIIGFSVAVLAAGCAHRSSTTTLPRDALTEEEWNVCEAVFRHLFAGNHSARQQEPAARWCLAISHAGWSEPDQTFLARFADLGPRIRGQSSFRPGRDVSFHITKIEKRAPGLYRVAGGCHVSPLSAYSTIFEVRREDGRWSVRKWPGEVELISNKVNPAPVSAGDWKLVARGPRFLHHGTAHTAHDCILLSPTAAVASPHMEHFSRARRPIELKLWVTDDRELRAIPNHRPLPA